MTGEEWRGARDRIREQRREARRVAWMTEADSIALNRAAISAARLVRIGARQRAHLTYRAAVASLGPRP